MDTPPSSSWFARNFTLGNVLTILAMLAAMYSFRIGTTAANATVIQETHLRIVHLETDVGDLKETMIPREAMTARLDGIKDRLDTISARLDRLEPRK